MTVYTQSALVMGQRRDTLSPDFFFFLGLKYLLGTEKSEAVCVLKTGLRFLFLIVY